MTGLENMRKTKLLPRKRRMLPTSGKLLVDNVAGIPNEGVVRVMPENKIYSYSGVVPTRKRRMKEKKVAPNWMDCNCQCHGFYDNTALDCPHCRPDRYKDWTVSDIKFNEPNL